MMKAHNPPSLVERIHKEALRASVGSFEKRCISVIAAALRELPEELCNSIANYFDPDEETERAIGNAVADWLEKEAQK